MVYGYNNYIGIVYCDIEYIISLKFKIYILFLNQIKCLILPTIDNILFG